VRATKARMEKTLEDARMFLRVQVRLNYYQMFTGNDS